MKRFSFSDILPYLIAIVAFYAVTFAFFKPELIDGKSLRQGDVMQYEGMSKKPVEYRETTGEQALWNDGMFSGMPDYLVSTGVPHHPLPWLFQFTRGFLDKDTAAHLFFLTTFCFWIALLSFRVNPYLAIFGALAFGLNTYNILNLEAGHVTKCWAIAYAPLVLAGMHLVFRGKIWLGAALFIIGFALHVRVPHYQITYYLAFICAIYGISELIFAIREKALFRFLQQTAVLLVGVAIGAMVVLGRFWMVQEYEKYSIRGQSELTDRDGTEPEKRGSGLDKEYAFAWSQGQMETLTMLIPHFYGGASNETLGPDSESYKILKRLMEPRRFQQMASAEGIALPTYRGEQPFTGGPLYAGAIVCFLFVLGMFVLEKRYRYWMLAGFIVAVFISWGKHFASFNYLMFDYFPAFNKFRAVMMAQSMAMMLMPIAGTIALQKLMEVNVTDALKKKVLVAVGITGGLAVLVAVFGGVFDYASPNDANYPEPLVKALEADRLSMARSDAFRSLIFIILSFGAIWLGMLRKIAPVTTFAIVGTLLVVDLWGVDKRYLKEEQFQRNAMRQITAPSPADQEILKDTDLHYRVFNVAPNAFQEARTSYFHKSIGGYFAAKLRRYQDLYEYQLSREQQLINSAVQNGQTEAIQRASVTHMLNAKYFIVGGRAVQNPYALGNAWFVEQVKEVNSPDEEIEEMRTLNTANQAVVDASKFQVSSSSFQRDSTALISLQSYTPKELVYRSQNQNDGLAVFSEIYYPEGWTATIDGKPTNILRVNYVLRALEVPSGNHEIRFEFAPKSYERGATVSQVGAIAATLLAVLFLLLHFVQQRKQRNENTV